MKHNERSYLSVRAVADEIRVPVTSVYRWVQKGELPVTRIVTPAGRRAIRVKRSHLEVFLKRSRYYEDATSDLSNKTLAEEITNERDSDGASKVSADTVEPEAEPSTLGLFARFARLLQRRSRRASRTTDRPGPVRGEIRKGVVRLSEWKPPLPRSRGAI